MLSICVPLPNFSAPLPNCDPSEGAGEQSSGTLVSGRSRVGLGSGMLYIDYIYPEFRI